MRDEKAHSVELRDEKVPFIELRDEKVPSVELRDEEAPFIELRDEEAPFEEAHSFELRDEEAHSVELRDEKVPFIELRDEEVPFIGLRDEKVPSVELREKNKEKKQEDDILEKIKQDIANQESLSALRAKTGESYWALIGNGRWTDPAKKNTTGLNQLVGFIGFFMTFITLTVRHVNGDILGLLSFVGGIGALMMLVSALLREPEIYHSPNYKNSRKVGDIIVTVGGIIALFPSLFLVGCGVAGFGLGLLVVIHLMYQTLFSRLTPGLTREAAAELMLQEATVNPLLMSPKPASEAFNPASPPVVTVKKSEPSASASSEPITPEAASQPFSP